METIPQYFRVKENCPIDPVQHYIQTGEIPVDHLEPIREDEFLDGSGKTICYGISFEQFEAIRHRREEIFSTIPS
ncbi:hypothetical protein GCM10011511_39810 [Puia dinghuensis]|uniref:Uncharacterized protein n=1 Tax=Puia dinghuensis TaxID=1792502 RepID=A0A8J2XUJ4_9BACT|nr:hypothetical protein GCM10011511_39810 [Puia dinghuensis]